MPTPTPLTLSAAFAAGVATWSLAEYVIHRGLGHRKLRNPFTREHLAHHADTTYFAPATKKALAALPVVGALAVIAVAITGVEVGLVYAAGFAAFYTFYEVLHRRIHVAAPIGAYGRWARRHHLHHHFKNPHGNHGVTSPIWDIVFGTHEVPGVVKVPAKHDIDWLRDPETGQIQERYRASFELAERLRTPALPR